MKFLFNAVLEQKSFCNCQGKVGHLGRKCLVSSSSFVVCLHIVGSVELLH
jgi:hypothetical protein